MLYYHSGHNNNSMGKVIKNVYKTYILILLVKKEIYVKNKISYMFALPLL